MIAILSVLIVVSLSMLITRIAAVALTHTGLSAQSAAFQARSAFTGAGFTTAESERVVDHPVRRRVIQVLMLLGNAGLVTAASALVVSFVGDDGDPIGLREVLVLGAGLFVLALIARSSFVERRLTAVIDRALRKYTDVEVRDFQSLLRLQGDYQLVDLKVEPDCWMADRALQELKLRDEGIVVLGILHENGTYEGVPNGQTLLETGAVAYLYGRSAALRRLDERPADAAGDRDHSAASEDQKSVEASERADCASTG